MMEMLESRTLLAGNVTVEVVRGLLRIRGDGAGNDIRVEQRETEGVRIFGNDNTAINGQGSFDAMGVGRRMRIDLGNGDNRLSVVGFSVFGGGDLVVRTGAGDDAIFLNSTNTKSLIVRTGGGQDVISLLTTSGQKALINSGDDSDFVSLDRAFEDDWTVRTGSGDDIIFHKDLSDKSPIFQTGSGRDVITTDNVVKEYNFEKGDEGWKAGFADYLPNQPTNGDFEAGVVTKPYSSQSRQRFKMRGVNRTDDLFMYLTRRLDRGDGLKPRTRYLLYFEVDFDSKEESGCFGVGGSPGEAVHVKAGASLASPGVAPDEEGVLRLNIDHGAQAEGGSGATSIGDISNGEECGTSQPPGIFIATQRRGVHEHLVKTDAKGRLHLIVGTDSGFEGETTIYYSKISVQLVEAFAAPRPFSQRYLPAT